MALQAFLQPTLAVGETIDRLVQLATVARKDGLLALEDVEIQDGFLAKGIRMAVDGVPQGDIRSALVSEMQSLRDRHRKGQRIFRFMGATAPAMGMVGTLIGLVMRFLVDHDIDAHRTANRRVEFVFIRNSPAG